MDLITVLKMLLKKIKPSTWCMMAALFLTLFYPFMSKVQNSTVCYIYSGVSFGLMALSVILLFVEWAIKKSKALSVDKELLNEEKDKIKDGLKTIEEQVKK